MASAKAIISAVNSKHPDLTVTDIFNYSDGWIVIAKKDPNSKDEADPFYKVTKNGEVIDISSADDPMGFRRALSAGAVWSNKGTKDVKHDGMKGKSLSHHGVKGQKWGVRRWQNSDGSWTPEGNERRRKGSRISNGGNIRQYQNEDGTLTREGIAKYNLQRNDDADTIVDKGIVFKRYTTKPTEVVKHVRKYVALDTNHEDMDWERLYSKYYDTYYMNQFKAKKDIRVAAPLTVYKAVLKLMNTDPDYSFEMTNSILDHRKETGDTGSGQGMITDFLRSAAMVNTATNKLFKYMKGLGYDAIADDFGIRSGSTTAMILLDPEDCVDQISSEKRGKK